MKKNPNNFADDYKKVCTIKQAKDLVKQDLNDGKILMSDYQNRLETLTLKKQSMMRENFLKNNAEKYGYTYKKEEM